MSKENTTDKSATASAESIAVPARRNYGGGRPPLPENERKVRVYGYVDKCVADWLQTVGKNIHDGVSTELTAAYRKKKGSAKT